MPYLTCPNRAAAAQRLADLLLRIGADHCKLMPILPAPGGDRPRLNDDDRAALRYALAGGKLVPMALARALGGAASPDIRKRASGSIKRLRDAGLIATLGATDAPGAHALTAEGRRIAAALGNPAADAAPDDERA
jgi:hypothetical protein